jgi:hypothetical protein
VAARPGLNIPTSELIGADLLATVKAMGYAVIRIDAQDLDVAGTVELAQEVLDVGLQPWTIIHTPEQIAALPEESLIEVGNEPDLDIPTPHGTTYGWTRTNYLTHLYPCLEAAGERRIYVYGVSNLNKRGFQFMPAADVWDTFGPEVGAAPHRYPETHGGWYTPHQGFATRQAEVDRLLAIIGERPHAIGEFGWNHADGSWRLEQCADFIAHDYDFYSLNGFEACVLYQVNDGPDRTDALQNYGIRDVDGVWNVTATAMMG